MKKSLLILFCLIYFQKAYPQEVRINTLSELFDYVKQKSSVMDNSQIQKKLARLTTKSAISNVINPRIPTTVSIVDNSKQAVSFIPGEIFGGPEGTYKEVTMGQRYISNLTFAPQFDLVNPGNYARIQSARINEQVAEVNARINEKETLEQASAIFYAILGYVEQKKNLIRNKDIADSIYIIAENKYQQGLARNQDLNEAKINKISVEDKIQQVDFIIRQQYSTLKTLCDAEEDIQITADFNDFYLPNQVPQVNGNLQLKSAELHRRFLEAELKAYKWQQLPTLSFFTNFSWQNNSNSRFLDSNTKIINSNFWGLRINWDLPTNVNKLSAYKTAQVNTRLAALNQKHSKFQNQNVNLQLELEYQKSISQYKNQSEILQLKKENFGMSMNQYEAGILGLDKLLTAHNELLVSELNHINSIASIQFASSKIEINTLY